MLKYSLISYPYFFPFHSNLIFLLQLLKLFFLKNLWHPANIFPDRLDAQFPADGCILAQKPDMQDSQIL